MALTGAYVLAAGGGTRFRGGQHKLLSPFRGRPLIVWAVEAAAAAGLAGGVTVVTGAVEPPAGLLPAATRLVANPRWAEGQGTSLAAALADADERGLDAVVVGLADQPLVPAPAWTAVAAAPHPLAVATYDGRRRNPVRLARQVWPLVHAAGDEGARRLMREQPDLVGEVACEGNPADIDTVEDLAQWS